MAEEKTNELNELAFSIYSVRMAGQSNRMPEREALESFRYAEAFLKVRSQIAKGELKVKEPEGVQLADCRAPNLKRTHPHNLVSKVWGNIDRVAKIKAWLDKHPTPEKDPQDLVHAINSEFPDLSWDLPAVNVARAIFPTYVKN